MLDNPQVFRSLLQDLANISLLDLFVLLARLEVLGLDPVEPEKIILEALVKRADAPRQIFVRLLLMLLFTSRLFVHSSSSSSFILFLLTFAATCDHHIDVPG